ncbi:DUF1799 domain-containing protein [Devosia sp.]|uniref:DUF1799 domain-containing protein n=1 Tax=Devosia sp. TaxID=1871048 RepID=UPI001AC5C00D|nr:DUF1799 domain-containing protein [Devosia sp.]MBN9335623.1 DUF1799 domain-containing protein [Devosia sp.]
MAGQFAEMGVSIPPEALEDEEMVELWDINELAFRVFQALDTQWHFVSGFNWMRRTGLNYPGVVVVMQAFDMAMSDFPLIQAMEEAALAAFDEVSSR